MSNTLPAEVQDIDPLTVSPVSDNDDTHAQVLGPNVPASAAPATPPATVIAPVAQNPPGISTMGEKEIADSKTTGNFLDVIINSLKQFFNPGGGQIFTLQFPGRFLALKEYAWDAEGAGIYAQFIKPVAVNEAEFRIADQMYDIADVVAGPKGINLSQVYEELLNNLLPIFQDTGLAEQQGKIREWLMKEVKAPRWVQDVVKRQGDHSKDKPVDPNTDFLGSALFSNPARLDDAGKVNRIELSNALMMDYLEAKQKWELERDSMIEEAMGIDPSTPESQRKLNHLTRKLAHITPIRQAQLSAKYSDAVVRGFSHNVREYMGYMDMKSSAEFLQEAKDALREAAMSSLDGSLKVYPVQMTPVNWWQGLSTNFSLEDLTQNPDLIKQQIDAKSQQLDVLNKELVALTFGTKGDVDKLREIVAVADTKLNETRAHLAKTYTSNVFSVAQMALDYRNRLNFDQLKSLMEPYKWDSDALNTLKTNMESLATAQMEANNATRAWTDAASRLALAEATDTRQHQEQIRLTMETLKKDIAELTTRYQGLNKAKALPAPVPDTDAPKLEDVPLLPGGSDQTSGGSRWQEITLHHQVESDYSHSESQSSSSTTSSHCNLWFWSSSQSSQQRQGSSQAEARKSSEEVWVGFRATLVTIDRAGWFRPQFFQESKMYYHINPELKWTKWPDDATTMDQLKDKGASNLNDLNKYLLPSYSVGFIVCKDITIKIAYGATQTEDTKSNMSKNSQSSGGVLCWSYSNGSSSSQSENSHSFQACQDGCVIRIPGPQILGYIIQLTHNDTTDKMPSKLPEKFFIPDASYDEALFNDRTTTPEEEAFIGPAGVGTKPQLLYNQLDEILKNANIPQEAMENVREAFTRELGIVPSEVLS